VNAPAYEAPAIVASSSIAPGYHSHAIKPLTAKDENICVWACWSCGVVAFWYSEPPTALYAFDAGGTWRRVTENYAATLRPPQAAPIPTCARCELAAQQTIDATEAARRDAAFIAGKS
jgi:hypothetical protein